MHIEIVTTDGIRNFLERLVSIAKELNVHLDDQRVIEEYKKRYKKIPPIYSDIIAHAIYYPDAEFQVKETENKGNCRYKRFKMNCLQYLTCDGFAKDGCCRANFDEMMKAKEGLKELKLDEQTSGVINGANLRTMIERLYVIAKELNKSITDEDVALEYCRRHGDYTNAIADYFVNPLYDPDNPFYYGIKYDDNGKMFVYKEPKKDNRVYVDKKDSTNKED